MSTTPYAETEALLAVLNGDTARARQLLDDMLPGERRVFTGQLNILADMVAEYCDLCGEHLPEDDVDDRLLMLAGRFRAHPGCADLAIASVDDEGKVTLTREEFAAARRG